MLNGQYPLKKSNGMGICGKHLEIHFPAGKLLNNWGIPMEIPAELPGRVRIGDVSLDVRAGELNHGQARIRLGQHSLQILLMLLDRPGEVVTREELASKLWPEDTYVDFEDGLNHAIRKLREALGDSPDTPRFIETVPRRGYRLVAPVDGLKVPGGAPLFSDQAGTGEKAYDRTNWRRFLLASGILLFVSFTTLIALNVAGLRDRIFGRPFPHIESIAVLPLENLSGDPEQEYFADGMTEELITTLGQVSALRVISRTSVMRYKGTKKTLPEIARELNVDGIVEGTVLRSGNRVRVTANLLHAQSDHHLWANSYERNLGDVLTLQDEVARAIADQIKVKLTPQEHGRLARGRPINTEAHEAYLMGRYQWTRRTEESLNRSIQYFQKAIEKDPGYAPAYAGLADSYANLGDNGFRRPRDVFPVARAAAVRALQLDPTLAEAHTSLGSVMKAYDWDWPGAEKELRRAIELNPNYATAHQFYGELLESEARFPEAVAELKRARQLDPFAPRIHSTLVWILYLARRYKEGLEAAQKGIEVDPHHAAFFSDRGLIYLQEGMYERALADFRKAEDLLPGPYYPHLCLVLAYAASGRKREALKVLAELNDLSKRRYVMPSLLAVAYSDLGDNQRAFTWLERAYEQRDPWLGFMLKSDPGFDPLRSNPRFQDILRRMNFPP